MTITNTNQESSFVDNLFEPECPDFDDEERELEFDSVFSEIMSSAAKRSGCYEEVFNRNVLKDIQNHLKTLSGDEATRFSDETEYLGYALGENSVREVEASYSKLMQELYGE